MDDFNEFDFITHNLPLDKLKEMDAFLEDNVKARSGPNYRTKMLRLWEKTQQELLKRKSDDLSNLIRSDHQ